MALAIEQALGRERLAASSLNVFRFVCAYHEAAQQLATYPALSKTTRSLLSRLERELRRSAPTRVPEAGEEEEPSKETRSADGEAVRGIERS